MVGEIRDKETAEIAINASLTGHLVLSTIHTNDAAGAVTRLVDMGVEPFLLRSSVIGILAQRLVRVLCPHCKEPYEAARLELEELGLTPERIARARRARSDPDTRYYPRSVAERDLLELDAGRASDVLHARKGCDKCAQTRASWAGAASTSSCMIDDAVGPLVLRRAPTRRRSSAPRMEQGMDTLRDDGARKVLAGLTTVEEVLAATQEDVDAPTASAADARRDREA